MEKLSPLREALLESIVYTIGVDINHPESGISRTPEQQSLVHRFNMDGKGGPWCADMLGMHFKEIAKQAGEINPDLVPLIDHADMMDDQGVISTLGLSKKAAELGALKSFSSYDLPQPGDIITMGLVKDQYIGRPDDPDDPTRIYSAIGKMPAIQDFDQFEAGQHTAVVISSRVITDENSVDKGWVEILSVDGNVPYDLDQDGVLDKQTIDVAMYLINPQTHEVQAFYYDLSLYPDSPDQGFTGKLAAFGFVDIEALPGALETNQALAKRGGFDTPDLGGVGYLDFRHYLLKQVAPSIIEDAPSSAYEILGPSLKDM